MWPPQQADRDPFICTGFPEAGRGDCFGGEQERVVLDARLVLFKTVPLSPQLASYAGGTWCFPYLGSAFHSTLWFPLLLGLCLLFTAPTFNSV